VASRSVPNLPILLLLLQSKPECLILAVQLWYPPDTRNSGPFSWCSDSRELCHQFFPLRGRVRRSLIPFRKHITPVARCHCELCFSHLCKPICLYAVGGFHEGSIFVRPERDPVCPIDPDTWPSLSLKGLDDGNDVYIHQPFVPRASLPHNQCSQTFARF